MANSRPSPIMELLVSGLSNESLQVTKPIWPFIAASGLTVFLVSKMQDAGVKCACLPTYFPLPPSY